MLLAYYLVLLDLLVYSLSFNFPFTGHEASIIVGEEGKKENFVTWCLPHFYQGSDELYWNNEQYWLTVQKFFQQKTHII